MPVKLEPGAVVANRFRLVRPLGRGGMGEVWIAHDLRLESPCAVKFLFATIEENAKKRFSLEAKAAAQLRSPNVVQVFDHGEAEGVPYIAMELLEGEDLATRLARRGRLDPRATVEIIAQIARALGRAHAAGVIHRDLKPANVFLVRDDDREVVKVLDFGIAKIYADEAPQSRHADRQEEVDTSMTATGLAMGTPRYMSPEQIEGGDLDARSDVWSLGVLAFECLTGRLPFESDKLGALYGLILSGAVPRATSLSPDLPPAVDDWVAKSLARYRDDRFATARELSDALQRSLGDTTFSSGSSQVAVASAQVDSGAATMPAPIPSPTMFAKTEIHPVTPVASPQVPPRRSRAWLIAVAALPIAALTITLAIARRSNEPAAAATSSTEEPTATEPTSTTAVPSASAAPTGWGVALPAFVRGSSTAVEVAPGAGHTCARLVSGEVTCWGRGFDGQFGAVVTSYSPPVMMPGLRDASRVVAGNVSTCIIKKDASLVCHGVDVVTPEGHPAMGRDVTAVALSPSRGVCAVKTSGQVACSKEVRGKVDASGYIVGITDAQQVVLGQDHACALRKSGAVVCWGSNDEFELAGKRGGIIETPREVPGATDIVQLAAGRAFTCARRRDGAVLCWGDPRYGALGSKDRGRIKSRVGDMMIVETPDVSRAEPVLALPKAIDLATGGSSACALVEGGDVYCWGANEEGTLGRGTFGDSTLKVGAIPPPPERVLSGAASVAVGSEHACALLTSGEVHCWGRNDEKQVGTEAGVKCDTVACVTRPTRVL